MQGLPVNKNFFSSWNSEMSYILGFIVADGCIGVKRIRKKDETRQYFLDITTKDIEHLENIRKAMSARQKILLKQGGHEKGYAYRIQIGHQKICRDLIELGILPRKTYNLGPIEVPKKYFSDFTRGFFDGDGTVYIYEVNGTPQIKAGFVSSSLSFITRFNQQLCESLNIATKSIHQTVDKRRNRITLHSICFYIDDCERLADFMYGNNPVLYLPRKCRIFKKWESVKRRHYVKQNYPSKIGWRLNKKVLA